VVHVSSDRVEGVAPIAYRPEAYLDRARLAVHYIRDLSSDLTTTLTFAVRNLLDIVGARSAAVWAYSADGVWACAASVSDGPPLPLNWMSWEALNLVTIQSDTVLVIPHPSRSTSEQHFAVPILHRENIGVLHVQAHVAPEHITAAKHFLLLVGPILTGAVCSHRGSHLRPHEMLTKRQRDIWELMPGSRTYRQIGQQLGFSESTIKQEAGRIFDRLSVRGRPEAIEYLARIGQRA
jgi:LuxR family transcriptional regulator, transcriptional regulator of spore coat protein